MQQRCGEEKSLFVTDQFIIFVRINESDMDAKLTLKLNKIVIDKAKEYAMSHNKSLSRMIESYLKSLIERDKQQSDDDFEISPFVRSMQTGVRLPADFDYKKEYGNYLAEKYK
jgi:uncharacterized protein YfcZ (UPF0381/DUF406 family)